MGLTTLGQHELVLPPQLILRDTMRGSAKLTILQLQQPQSQMPSQVYVNYAMGSPQVNFFFAVEPPTNFFCVGSVIVFSAVGFPYDCHVCE